MSSLTRPSPFRVGIAAAILFLAGVGTLARYHAGYPLNPLDSLGRDSTPEGRRELRALRRDPVLDFRAPGTRLRRSTEVAAGRDWKNAAQPTEIRRVYSLKGEPGVAADAYRARAMAVGWQLHDVQCSLEYAYASADLTRSVNGQTVTLQIYAYLERDTTYHRDRGISVVITGEDPRRPADGPEGANLARRDLHCLRTYDPASPDLLPPAIQPESAAAVCGLLTLAEVRSVVPAVSDAKPWTNAGQGCRYATGRDSGFSVFGADQPRAHYRDRQSPQDPGDRRFVLLDEDTSGPPTGAWVDTRLGPVQIYASRSLDARQLVALAELLGRR